MADEVSFTLSSSSASGAAAAVADGSSAGRQTQVSVSSESSVSNVTSGAASAGGQREGRSRSPSRLPTMPEDAMVPFQEENAEMQVVGQGEMGRMDVSSGDRRGSSRDAAGTQRRALTLQQPV